MIDTHTHVVSHDEDAYPLAVTELPNGAWFLEHRRDADELIAEMDGAGVDGVVFVQPSAAYSTDNRCLVDAQARHPQRSVAVCTLDVDPSADPAAPETAAAELRRLVTTAGVGGIRLFALDFSGGDGWIADPCTTPVWEELAALNVPAVATVFTAQLGALGTMLNRFPMVTVCLDHCAFPPLGEMATDAAMAPLLGLAGHDNLRLKVTTHLLADDHGAEALRLLRHGFGASRMMWGSDYPQWHDRPYSELVGLGRSAVDRWSSPEQDDFIGMTAAGVWPALRSTGHRGDPA